MINCVFDIETVPQATDKLEAALPVFDADSVKVGQLTPEKAQAKIDKAAREHLQNFYKKAALSALTGQIAMLGVWNEAGHHIFEGQEPDIIRTAFALFSSKLDDHFIGFNITSFDIPFLVRRAWVNKIEIPNGLFRSRYLDSDRFTDLMQLWTLTERGANEFFPVSLDRLAHYFGIGTKKGTGAQFHELLRYQPKEAREYLLNDLELTWKIADRMGALRKGAPKAAAPSVIVSRNGAEIIFY